MKKTLIVLIIAIAVVIVFCVLFFDRCPESCTTDYLQKWFDSAQYPCGVSFDGIDRTENTSLLAEMMSFSEWQKIRKPSAGEKELITIIMSEEYEITVYESYVKVHDGYSRIGEAEDVFYSVPERIIKELTDYRNKISVQ